MNPTLYCPSGKAVKRAVGFERRYVAEDQSGCEDLVSAASIPVDERSSIEECLIVRDRAITP